MDEQQTQALLRQLGSHEPHEAWASFLDLFSPLIHEVVRHFEHEEDAVADCFLFVCEQLSRDRFQRLRRFRPEGPARFSTWLCVVVRNLCLDWHRREFGRHRVFESISQLPAFEQEVFRCLYEEDLSLEETYMMLRPRFPERTYEQMCAATERIQQILTPRQQWLLSLRHAQDTQACVEGTEPGCAPGVQVASPAPDPELLAALQERRGVLQRALSRLSKRERLLIRLRFERELTLEQVARVLHLGDAQGADRRVRGVLEKLRSEVDRFEKVAKKEQGRPCN